jgi:DNA polymerase-3 subunit epsilon
MLEKAEYVVVDTELTGLNGKKDSIVSIGALRITGGRIDLSDSFYSLVNPETHLTAESVIIHEITPAEVFEKPDIRTELAEFLRFCGDDIIVGWEAKRVLGHTIQNPVLDIFPIFEWVRSNRTARVGEEIIVPFHYKLYDIAKYYGIEVNGAHNALIDAFITAQIFQRFIHTNEPVSGVGRCFKVFEQTKRRTDFRNPWHEQFQNRALTLLKHVNRRSRRMSSKNSPRNS